MKLSQKPCCAEKDSTLAWLNRCAVKFSIELAATGTLYPKIKVFTDQLIEDAYTQSKDFTNVSAVWIKANPHFLPVFMHVARVFSKGALKKEIGSANDNLISRPASENIEKMLSAASGLRAVPSKLDIQTSIKGTVEGIVRDLVGRLLLEEFVASALTRNAVPFLRENEYINLVGVVYDFRADFVAPNENKPKAFLEVRKSSSRHASLYAKDKMFSAINWKGKHPECLAVLIVDGPWTDVTLKIMSKIFDYVVPIGQVDEVAAKIKLYLDGDQSILQWMIQFSILKNIPGSAPEVAEKIKLTAEEEQQTGSAEL
jgi:hypothetical protein